LKQTTSLIMFFHLTIPNILNAKIVFSSQMPNYCVNNAYKMRFPIY